VFIGSPSWSLVYVYSMMSVGFVNTVDSPAVSMSGVPVFGWWGSNRFRGGQLYNAITELWRKTLGGPNVSS